MHFHWSACPWKRTNKGNDLALSVQSQVKLVQLLYIVDNTYIVIEVRSHVAIFKVLSVYSTTYYVIITVIMYILLKAEPLLWYLKPGIGAN